MRWLAPFFDFAFMHKITLPYAIMCRKRVEKTQIGDKMHFFCIFLYFFELMTGFVSLR